MPEKELLKTVRHMALSTVNEDGTPHNTPLFFAVDDEFGKIFFASKPESIHCKNFIRTGKGFVVVYDSNEFKGGLYLTLGNCRIATDIESPKSLGIYETRCMKFGIDVLPKNFHNINSGYKLFVGEILKIEIYDSEENKNGHLKNEARKEITPEDLLSD